MNRTRFWEMLGIGLLILWTAAFLGNGLFELGHVFHTEPGVVLAAITLIVVGMAGAIAGVGAVLTWLRKRTLPR